MNLLQLADQHVDQNPEQSSEDEDWSIQIKGLDGKVETQNIKDGDTFGNYEGESNRLRGFDSEEITKGIYDSDDDSDKAIKFKFGEIGGEHDKRVLRDVINSEPAGTFQISKQERQSRGAGAGKRFETSLINTRTGADVSQYLLEEGLTTPHLFATEADLEAYDAGILRRSLFGEGEDDLANKLRDERPDRAPIFKTRALNKEFFQDADKYKKEKDRTWYAVADADLLYSDVVFDQAGTDAKGYSLNPISDAFSKGWKNASSDFGAAASLAGFATGIESLEAWGDKISAVQGLKAEGIARPEIQTFKDLTVKSDGAVETVSNGIKYLATTTASSLPYMGAIFGGAALAPALGATGATALVLGTAPSAIVHAGTIWNSVDKYQRDENGNFKTDEDGSLISNRTALAAGASLTGGIAAATLDRLGLHAVVAPTQFLKKIGTNKAAKALAKKEGIPFDDALTKVNKVYLEEADKALKFVSGSATETAKKAAQAKAALAGVIKFAATKGGSGVAEGITEALQEATTYTIGSALNEQPADPLDLLKKIREKVDLSDEQFKDLLTESFAGGFGVGTSLGVAKSGYDLTHDLRQKAWESESNPLRDLGTYRNTINEIRDAFKGAGTENTDITSVRDITDQLADTAKNAEGFRTEKTFDERAQAGEKDNAVSRVQRGDSSAGKEAVHALKGLVMTPLGRLATNTRLKQAPSLLKLTSIVGGLPGGVAGRSFERETDYRDGSLANVFSAETASNQFGFSLARDKVRKDLSEKFYKFGDAFEKSKFNIHKLNLKALQDNGLIDSKVDISKGFAKLDNNVKNELFKLKDLYTSAETHADILLNMQNDTRTNKIQRKKNWVTKHRELDPAPIKANRAKFEKDIVARLATIGKSSKSKSKELLGDAFKSPELYAKSLADNIIYGIDMPGQFSRVSDDSLIVGEDKTRTKLFLSDANVDGDGINFDEFFFNDVFETMKRARQKTVRDNVHLEYFGNKADKLSVLFDQIQNELVQAGAMTSSEIDTYMNQLAQQTKAVIDSSTGNYKQFATEHPTLHAVQEGILTYTTILGLPLAAITSIPETVAIAIGLRDNKEFQKFVKTIGKEFGDALIRSVKPRKIDKNAPASKDNARIENIFFEMQQVAGIPQDAQAISRRLGQGEVGDINTGGLQDRLKTSFFKLTLLSGLTSVQRTIATSTALDFIRNRANALIQTDANDGSLFVIDTKGKLSREQFDAYQALSQLGINPELLLESLVAQANAKQGVSIEQFLGPEFKPTQITTGFTDRSSLEEQVLTGVQSYVNTRIQDPNASNRPLIVQDPRFKLLTQFNSFLSAVTTTLVPKIWNDEIGRGVRNRNPGMTYDIFAVLVAMTLLGGASQYLKDLLKFGESSPYIDDPVRKYQRWVASTGVLGQYEKILDAVHPLYPQRGEGIGGRALGTLLGSGGRHVEGLADLLTPSPSEGKAKEEFANDALKYAPVFSVFTGARHAAVDWLK